MELPVEAHNTATSQASFVHLFEINMAEGVSTQVAIKERIVADYSEIKVTDHTRSGTTDIAELRAKLKFSVRERITQIESKSLSPQDLEAYLLSVC